MKFYQSLPIKAAVAIEKSHESAITTTTNKKSRGSRGFPDPFVEKYSAFYLKNLIRCIN